MINHPRRSRAKAVSALAEHDHEADYAALLEAVTRSFDAAQGPLFTTNAAGMYEAYLANLPAEQDVHSCTACRRFIESFGGLVHIGEDGRAQSAIWSCVAPGFYTRSIAAMRKEVERSRVTGPFYSVERRYGMPKTGEWTHFAVTPDRASVFVERTLTAGQAMASKREDFRTVATALGDFTPEMLTEALRLLEADTLARSERFVAPVRWLLDLHTARKNAKDSRIRDNVLWRAIAVAPEGYCHPRASMTGALLDDIAAGLDFAEVKRRFDAKMHPLQFQRPQAAPASGAIAAAEKLVEKLGIAPALERRIARLDEVEAFWTPSGNGHAPSKDGGVFGHLKPKGAPEAFGVSGMPAVTMTWEKFERTVLPNAKEIKAFVPAHGSFIGMTTAVHADAPPILRWDREDARNPVAWYLWVSGSPASQWGLTGNAWCDVPALTRLPTMWGGNPAPHLGDGVILLLDGALDTRNDHGAIFPETLRDELHGIRSVVEAYCRTAKLGAPDGPAACGLDLRKGQKMDYRLRVTSDTGTTDYRIDRWD